jgi:nitrate reductase NapD
MMVDCGSGRAVNISSAVVSAFPRCAEEVRQTLSALPGVEVHAVSAEGSIVITLECSGDQEATAAFETVRQTTGVLSAALVFMQTEQDPNQEICDEIDAT